MGIWRQGVDFATVIVFGRENTSICMASSYTSEEVKVRNGEKVSAPRNIGVQQNDKKRKICSISFIMWTCFKHVHHVT